MSFGQTGPPCLGRRRFLFILQLCLGLLFALQAAWSSVPETPQIEVRRSEIAERVEAYRRQMGRDATDEEARAIENQVVENAIWLEQAFALGLHEIDSVVHQRLILNMRFLEGDSDASDESLVARAFELGMDRSDTVVQRRLVDLGSEIEGIREEAGRRAEEEADRILVDARATADRIRRDAQAAVGQELRRAQSTLREEAADLALELAARKLNEEVGEADRERLVDEFILRVEANSGEGVDR